MITPQELSNPDRIEYKRKLIELEKLIDDHLYKWYTGHGCKLPGIIIEPITGVVLKKLLHTYEETWIVRIETTENPTENILYFSEKLK